MSEKCKDRFHVNINIQSCHTSGQSGSEQIEVARRRPGAADCRNERHRARLASRRGGDEAHRDIERGKLGPDGIGDKMVPSAARVACIAGAACTSLDQNSNKLVDVNVRTVRT